MLVGTSFCASICQADDYTGWQTSHPEWELVFEDNFQGDSLDTTKWNKLPYVDWANVSDWRKYYSRDDELIQLDGENVQLWGKYGDFTSQSDQTGAQDTYACAGIFTNETFTFQYGYVEVRAKLDSAAGAWPAIWMMPVDGSNWPKNGEIDIMEHLNWQGHFYQTIHYWNAGGKNTSQSAQVGYPANLDKTQWHTYGLEWTEDYVRFFLDGKETKTFLTEPDNPNWAFNKEGNEYYLMLDMQWGGDWVEGALPDGTQPDIGDGVAMTIDYVRVYSSPIPEPVSAMLGVMALAGMSLRRRRR